MLGLGGKHNYTADDVPDLHGKTALVTGATTSVGLEVAKVFASKGARVLILAREEDDPDKALERIRKYCAKEDSGDTKPDLQFVECDLSRLDEVRRVGDELCERESRLDIVVCDAGLGVHPFDASADGIDLHIAVSHLGHFLLLNRLLPLLHRTATNSPSAPRIVCVSSKLHAAAPSSATFITCAELTAESYAASSPIALYARAKLAAILFVKFGLAPRLSAPPTRRPRGILALATDPGAVHPGQPSQFADAYGPVTGTAAQLATAPMESSPAKAARSTLWAATAPEVEDEWDRWQGAYVVEPGHEGDGSSMAQDAERGARLWAMSEDLVRKSLSEDALLPWSWKASKSEDPKQHHQS
ncbi:hypothetical protein C8Q77DRAFT_1200860 [Trametes polyzona]|nr:hypothetical protein C8Q77DRAFT_1200860 [Trametes polyzona]